MCVEQMRARREEDFEAIGVRIKVSPSCPCAGCCCIIEWHEIRKRDRLSSIDSLSRNTYGRQERDWDSAVVSGYTILGCLASVLGHTCAYQPLLHPKMMQLVILKSIVQVIHSKSYQKIKKTCSSNVSAAIKIHWLKKLLGSCCNTAVIENQSASSFTSFFEA